MLDEAGFGYDPTIPEPFEITRPRFQEALPPAAAVNPAFLPPVLASGRALVFGTRLFTDWGAYQGAPLPYWGNGTVLVGGSAKPAGHCMLIVGYDDTLRAVRIQNSQGTDWGTGGYVWMAYTTFQTLAQGSALYVPN